MLLLQLLGLQLLSMQLGGLLLALQVLGCGRLLRVVAGCRHEVAQALLLQQLDDVLLVLIHVLQEYFYVWCFSQVLTAILEITALQ